MSYTNGLDKPSDYFNTKLYTGTGAELALTGVGFQPDWVWIKRRNTVEDNMLYDVIRGATIDLRSNLTNADGSNAQGLKSFDSDGFTLGTMVNVNQSSSTYASWNWLAGGTGVSNTDGSITSTVSANTTAGFSIVTYTGTGANATVGHGLSSAPKFVIHKNRTDASNWLVWHTGLGGGDKTIEFNLTNAVITTTSPYNSTVPSSSVVSLGTNNATNGSGDSMIAYCFAEKKGYSKFGSYTGNGNANGTFIYTGFKPAFVIVKRTDTAGNSWFIWDNKRATYNEMVNCLIANTNGAELTDREIDFLSNGFKTRANDGNYNASGGTYIYMAFAENPFVTGAVKLPTTAR